MKTHKKNIRLLALFIAIIMIVSVSALVVNALEAKIPVDAAVKAADVNEGSIAADISNITGASVEAVLKLRGQGKTWNEILAELKNKNNKKGASNLQRDNLLSASSIDESLIKKIKKEGFSDDEIQQAKLLVERTLFQLDSITGASFEMAVKAGSPEVQGTTDDMKPYADIASKFDASACLYLILKLEKDLGGVEKAMDEYLFSLQADIDLALYFADKEDYMKLRHEKEAGMDIGNIITASAIEEKMLKKLQENNKSVVESSTKNEDATLKGNGVNSITAGSENVLPDVPNPASDIVKPQNPADQIKNEIDALDPMKNINGGNVQ